MRTRHERFDAKCADPDENGCIRWTGYCNQTGYGRFWNGSSDVLAHRFNYERFVGTIPEGLELDHLCRVRECVNPAHLEPVTRSENVRRGAAPAATRARAAAITHCPRGHEYTPENTYMQQTGAYQCRGCRACHRARAAARYAARRKVA